MDLDIEQDVAQSRRVPFVVSVLVAAAGTLVDLLALLPTLSPSLVVARTAVVAMLVVAAVGVFTRRLPSDDGDKLAWAAGVAYAALAFAATTGRDDPGSDFEKALRIIVFHMPLCLATYLVWPLRIARWIVGALAAGAWYGFAFTLAGHPEASEVVGSYVFPPIFTALCEVAMSRTDVLTTVATQAAAEAERGRTDQLTGLPNRRGLMPRLEAMAAGDSVLVIDIDHFKEVNDDHGHDTGDAVLRRVASLLERSIRAGDAIGRWGGEEFVVVAGPRTRRDGECIVDGLTLGRRLCAVVRDDDRTPTVTISVGTDVMGRTDRWQDVLSRADAYLYDAKEAGRDRALGAPCCVDDDPVDEPARPRAAE